MSAEPKVRIEDAAKAQGFLVEDDAPETFNVLLYGPTGAGKSTAAATAPGPMLWVNAEGPGALAFPRKVARERDARIFEARVERDADIRGRLRQVIEHVRYGKEPHPQTVVVDTVAKVRDALIRQIVQPGARNSIQQFGEVAKVLEEFVRLMRDLPVNLILLCHEDITEAEGERIVQPLIGGVLTPKIPAEMDVVAYCGVVRDEETEAVRYMGQLAEGRGRRAKDRSGGLGVARDLDLTEWLGVYRDALALDTEEHDDADEVEGGDEQSPEGQAQAGEAGEFAEEFTKPLEGS